ncbi:trihelix transcription factor ASIL2-like [Triticum dicoccoides]|uniref:trihelix transcription factor ASIL2-like n=1 Tax=Triticum dicoccoides TaxID=85692 RepID=UPI00188EE8B6|nr:trihelix transcription factor ASIL2-like [Triticum dicoccoides]
MDDDDNSPSPSLSPASSSPLPVASALPVADPVTVASAPPGGPLTLALPIQKHGSYPSHGGSGGGGGGGGGGREDAWSEGATSALIDAWGERFVALGRGSLRHPQWQEVAEAVSSRDNYSKAPKSDVQCKNRIDTLKKKYKIERAKPVSSWQFYDRLDVLLAPTYNQKPAAHPNGRNAVPTALRAGFPQRSRTPLMPASAPVKRRAPSPELSASSESSDGFPPEPALPAANGKRRRTDEGRVDGFSGGDRSQGMRELAQALRRFGEAYERVETAKLEQAAEIERQRLDFARELESQRVQFFLNTQKELSQGKSHISPAAAASHSQVGAATVGGSSRRMASAPDSTSRRMAPFPDARTSSNHHDRYRASDGSRHHHRPAVRPHYQYHENNMADSAAASDGEQSGDEEEEEDDDNEEESQ